MDADDDRKPDFQKELKDLINQRIAAKRQRLDMLREGMMPLPIVAPQPEATVAPAVIVAPVLTAAEPSVTAANKWLLTYCSDALSTIWPFLHPHKSTKPLHLLHGG